MDIFSVDLTVVEIQLLRQALDIITISGKDAKAVANLQLKLESEMSAIQAMIKRAEVEKQQQLLEALDAEKNKASKTK